MILYGTPEELAKALEEEAVKLLSLKGRDPHLDKFIDKKLRILKECLTKLKRTKTSQVQVIAISSCYLVEL